MTADDIAKLLRPSPTYWFVGAGGSDGNDGLTWATRKLTISSTIGVAVDDDTIVCGKNTFPERINTSKRLHLVGASATGTIISGSGTSPAFKLGAGSSVRDLCVNSAGGEAVTVEGADGFRATRCYFKNNAGGGTAYNTSYQRDVLDDTVLQGAFAIASDSSSVMAFRVNFIGAIQGVIVAYECQPSSANASVATITPTITLAPIVGSRNPTNAVGSPIALEMFQKDSKVFLFTVLDSAGSIVVLTGKTLRFVVHDNALPAVGLFDIENAFIAVTGVGNNIANVTVSSAKSNQAEGEYQWRLWDVTTAGSEKVLLWGPFTLLKSVQDVA